MATRPIRVSEKNMMKLQKMKLERGYSSFDNVITRLLKENNKKNNKKRKKKRTRELSLFNAREFGF